MGNSVRIDKWLWSARLYKTRSLAAEACRKGKIIIADQKVKASRMIEQGEVISIRKNAFSLTIKVLNPIRNRIPAKLVPEVWQDLTPEHEYEKLEMMRMAGFGQREAGSGRPTKKERRDLEDFWGNDED